MYRTFALIVLAGVLGCAEDPDPVFPVATPNAPEELPVATDTADGLPKTPDDVPLEYSESVAVQRLLVRASELEESGRFQDALELVNDAVAVDPHSPRAHEMKARLEELLRRIQPIRGLDGRASAEQIVQRTTP